MFGFLHLQGSSHKHVLIAYCMTVCGLVSAGHIFYAAGHMTPHEKHAHCFSPPSGLPLVNCSLILSVSFGEHLFLQLPTSSAPMFYKTGGQSNSLGHPRNRPDFNSRSLREADFSLRHQPSFISFLSQPCLWILPVSCLQKKSATTFHIAELSYHE